MSDVILTERAGPVATVSLNRPDKMNALNLPMWEGLGRAFAELAADSAVRCIVLRGMGEKAFAPGADIDEFDTKRATAEQASAYDKILRDALARVRECPQPVIAMIHGPCVGGGLELACQCDLRISGESGRFGVPINRIGVVMAYPEIAAIERLIGPARTLEIFLEAKIMNAAEALNIGLINRVVPDDKLADEIAATTKRIVAGSPLGNAWHKAFVRRLGNPAPITEAEMRECYAFLATDDYREGLEAFRAKRAPKFQGR